MSLMPPFTDVNVPWYTHSVSPSQQYPVQYGAAALPPLGSSFSTNQWSWSSVTPGRHAVRGAGTAVRRDHGTMMRVAREAMRQAAQETGQDIATLWLSAALEWLERHVPDQEPQPPAPTIALRSPRRVRSWQEVDAILTDLRDDEARNSQDAA
jgi:hypothetical protein